MKKSYIFILFISLLLFGYFTFNSQIKHSENLTGLYTNMQYNEESGDINGVELFIVTKREGYIAYFQDAEGGPFLPIIIPIEIKNKKIEFEIPKRGHGYSGKFIGIIHESSIELSNSSEASNQKSNEKIILLKGLSYWQK